MSEGSTLVVLAAGIGSRYGGLKQVQPIGPGGEAVLDYSVFDARRAGFTRFVFVIREAIEQDFRTLLARRFEKHLDVQYAFQSLDRLPPGFTVPAERQKPWGTGHAVLCAEEKVTGPFAVINADDFYGAQSFQTLGNFLNTPRPPAAQEDYAMVGFRLDRTLSEHGTVARGVCRVAGNGLLESVEELTGIERTASGLGNRLADGSLQSLTGGEIVSLNCWGFQCGLFGHLRRLFAEFLAANQANPKAEFYLPGAVNALLQAGSAQVHVLPTPCSWFGVTYREDLPVVIESIRQLVRAGEYPERLWE